MLKARITSGCDHFLSYETVVFKNLEAFCKYKHNFRQLKNCWNCRFKNAGVSSRLIFCLYVDKQMQGIDNPVEFSNYWSLNPDLPCVSKTSYLLFVYVYVDNVRAVIVPVPMRIFLSEANRSPKSFSLCNLTYFRQSSVTSYCTVLYNAVMYFTVLPCTVMHCHVQYCTCIVLKCS